MTTVDEEPQLHFKKGTGPFGRIGCWCGMLANGRSAWHHSRCNKVDFSRGSRPGGPHPTQRAAYLESGTWPR